MIVACKTALSRCFQKRSGTPLAFSYPLDMVILEGDDDDDEDDEDIDDDEDGMQYLPINFSMMPPSV